MMGILEDCGSEVQEAFLDSPPNIQMEDSEDRQSPTIVKMESVPRFPDFLATIHSITVSWKIRAKKSEPES